MEEKSIYEILYYVFLTIVSIGTLTFSIISFILNFKQNNKRIEEEQTIRNNMEKNKRDQEKYIESIKLENQKEIQEFISKNETKTYVTKSKYDQDLLFFSKYKEFENKSFQAINYLKDRIEKSKYDIDIVNEYKTMSHEIRKNINDYISFLNQRSYIVKKEILTEINKKSNIFKNVRTSVLNTFFSEMNISIEILKELNVFLKDSMQNLKDVNINKTIRNYLESLELK